MRFSALSPLCLLLALSPYGVARALTADEPARIVRPGQVVRLEVRDAPAGGLVRFTLPAEGPGGVFGDGSVLAEISASQAGAASALFTVGDSPGPFLADATAASTDESVSFALTVLQPGEDGPILGPEEARAMAIEAAGPGEALHGPVLVRAGVEVRSPVPAVVFDQNAPFVAARDAWLAWVDTEPRARFGHLTRWVLIDAETGARRTIHQNWWPELRTSGSPNAAPLLGASRANRHPRGEIVLPVPPGQGPADACMVGLLGDRLPLTWQDSMGISAILTESRQVSAEKVRFARNAAEARDALAASALEGCRRSILVVSAHAGQARGGGVLLEGSYLTYAELAEWLTPFAEVQAVLATSFAAEASTWFDGRGFAGVVLGSAFEQNAAPLDAVRRLVAAGGATLAEAHRSAYPTGTAPPPHAIAASGPRRMWLSDVHIHDAGGQQRIDVTRPLNLGLGPTLIYNASEADPETAGIQTKVFVLPSDQDLLRFAFGGRRRGETSYEITTNDSAQQVYRAQGRIEIGSFALEPNGVVLRTESPRRTVTLRRHGYWWRRRAPTSFRVTSRDESIVVPEEMVVETAAGEATIELQAIGPGKTYVDIWDSTAGNAASLEVEALGPPDLDCPAQGSAQVSYAIAAGGDPAGVANRVALSSGMLYWKRDGGRIQLWGDKAPILTAEGAVTADCRFSAAGDSGQERVAGVVGLAAVYANGRIAVASGEIGFDYRLGPLEPGQTVTYAATGRPAAYSGLLGASALLEKQSGGERSLAVGVAGGAAWTATSDVDWVRIAGGGAGEGPGFARFLVTPNGSTERRTGRLTIAGETVTVTQAAGPNLAEPLVTGVFNAATFQEGNAAGTWLTISGFGLSNETRTWFSEPPAGVGQPGGPLPTTLAGVNVKIDGKPAYVQFVSPGQINVLSPDDPALGRVDVTVTNNGRVSAPVQISKQEIAPELFRFQPREGRYPAAVHPDGALVGPRGLFRTVVTRPAAPGGVVLLFGSGFGATGPATPTGFLVNQPARLAAPAAASIGGSPAEVLFGGLTASGLYQFNVVVPELPPGDHPIELWSAGRALETTAYLTVE